LEDECKIQLPPLIEGEIIPRITLNKNRALNKIIKIGPLPLPFYAYIYYLFFRN